MSTVPFKDAVSSWVNGPDRRIHEKIGDWISVKDFGAKGDGSTDDSGAIQAAIDARVPLFFPAGDYRVSRIITFTDYLVMYGAGGGRFGHAAGSLAARVIGDHVGPTFCQAPSDDPTLPAYKTHEGTWTTLPNGRIAANHVSNGAHVCVEDMHIENAHPLGECLVFHASSGNVQSRILGCLFRSQFRGVMGYGFSINIIGCRFAGNGSGAKSGVWDNQWPVEQMFEAAREMWGYAGSGYLIGNNFTGWGVGCHVTGTHSALVASRFEVNCWGAIIGGVPRSPARNGDPVFSRPLQSGMVGSIAMEGNGRGLHLDLVHAGVQVGPVGIYSGTVGVAPPFINENGRTIGEHGPNGGRAEWGMLVDAGSAWNINLDNVQVDGRYLKGGVIVPGYAPVGRIGTSVRDADDKETDQPWAVRGSRHPVARSVDYGRSIIDWAANWSENHGLANRSRQLVQFLPNLEMRGITGLNLRDARVLAKNLGGLEAVAERATSHAVTFFSGETSGAAFSAGPPVASADGCSTLPAGTHWYAISTVTKYGETGVTTGSGQTQRSIETIEGQKVIVKLGKVGTPEKPVRLYRGPGPGAADKLGFWEFTSGERSFEDTGQPFDGYDVPHNHWSVPSHEEDDANYAVVATPSWGTTVWITGKATTGFTLNFGTAAPDGASVQWLLFRP